MNIDFKGIIKQCSQFEMNFCILQMSAIRVAKYENKLYVYRIKKAFRIIYFELLVYILYPNLLLNTF